MIWIRIFSKNGDTCLWKGTWDNADIMNNHYPNSILFVLFKLRELN